MKKVFLFFGLLGICFALGVAAHRLPAQSAPPLEESPFAPAPYPLLKHPFVVVLIEKDNGAFLEKQLASLFSQVYENMRIVYIDDASEDGSASLAEALILESEKLPIVSFFRNPEALGRERNLERIAAECRPEEIVVVLEPKTWLAHEWVLERLNQYYADRALWSATALSYSYPDYAPLEGSLYTARAPLFQQGKREEPFRLREVFTLEAR